MDYLQVFRCAVKGFPCCSISDNARGGIHCQGCGNQAGVGVWPQLQSQAGSEPVVQHWDFASATLKPAGEGLSPPMGPAQGDAQASLNAHKMSVEKR